MPSPTTFHAPAPAVASEQPPAQTRGERTLTRRRQTAHGERVTLLHYDTLGHLIQTWNENGVRTDYTFDQEGRINRVTSGKGTVVLVEYVGATTAISRVINGEAMIPGDGLRWENRRLVRVDPQVGEVAEVIDDPTRLLGVPDVEGDAGFKEER